MPRFTRRAALQAGAQVTAAVAASACGPKGGPAAAGGETAEVGSIDHVIVIMMENRSFNHFLGARKLTEGKADEDGLTADMSNPDASGVLVSPYASDEVCIYDPPHGWESSHRQFSEGTNQGFVIEYGARGAPNSGHGAMQYLTRDDVPITWALADAYTVCDRWFCSIMGPTWPNRLMAHLATSDGKIDNSFPAGTLFTNRSVWKALEEAGVSWAYYYTDLPFIGLLADHWTDDTVFMVEEFAGHVSGGTLPSVVWIDPGFAYNDNHPPHHVGLGELFIAGIYETLAASPYWDKCLIVLLYDEHGGFFDHVAPPTTDDDLAAEGFDQLGFRVPTLLIGPYVKAGVDHTVYDHTSWIKYVCERFGIEPWNKRLLAANSIGLALDLDAMADNAPRPPVALPGFAFSEDEVPDECFYGAAPDHLLKLALLARDQGHAVRFPDVVAARSAFLDQWRARGLIG